jgi:hypothetical protein
MPNDLIRVTTATSAIFTSHEQDRLDQIQRFLVRAGDPDIAPVLAQAGFDAAELEEGWQDWDIAVGRKIPFEIHLVSQQRGELAGLSAAQDARLTVLDEFDNAWQVRTRNAIRRFVVKDQRAAFEAAMFQDLSRQPKGPGLVKSVGILLDRLESIRKSPVPGAKETFEALRKKGLTDALLQSTRDLVEAARKEFDPTSTQGSEDEKIRQLAQERREAYERVNAWYIDWADAVRGRLTYHQAVRLGVTKPKGGRRPADGPESPADPSEPTGPTE